MRVFTLPSMNSGVLITLCRNGIVMIIHSTLNSSDIVLNTEELFDMKPKPGWIA